LDRAAKLGFRGLAGGGRLHGQLQTPDRIVFMSHHEHVGGQALARGRRFQQQLCNLATEIIPGSRKRFSPWEYHYAQHPPADPARKILENAVKRILDPVKTIVKRPFDDWKIGARPAIVFVSLENRGCDVELAEDVAQPRREFFAALQVAAQKQHRHVSRESESRAQTRELPRGRTQLWRTRHADKMRARHSLPQRPCGIADDKPDMLP